MWHFFRLSTLRARVGDNQKPVTSVTVEKRRANASNGGLSGPD
jgi:hypothetical protein